MYCGLTITENNGLQTITQINFNIDFNLNGTLPKSIDAFSNLSAISLLNNPLIIGTIPNNICNLTYLDFIELRNLNINGILPNCIAKMDNMVYINFDSVPKLTIYENIFCYNTITYYTLDKVNYTGSIPECIGNRQKPIQSLQLNDLPNLYGTIPKSFYNLTDSTFSHLILNDLPNLSGSIPKFSINCNLVYFQLTSLPKLNGTISDDLCNCKDLYDLFIANTSITGTLPQCISNLTVSALVLNSNNLYGTFPPILSANIRWFEIQESSFEGSISTIFPLHNYSELETVFLHSNKFYDNNIGIFLEKIFKYSPYIEMITLFDNDYISGDFPTFDDDDNDDEIHLQYFKILSAQLLDIGGVLPNNLYLGNNDTFKYESFVLMLFGNRLSSNIPKYFVIPNNITEMLLIGNLFTIYNNNDIPKWLENSPFLDTPILYLSNTDIIQSWIKTIIIFICLILITIKIKYNPIKYVDIEFIENIKKIDKYLSDYKLLIIIYSLIIFYPFSCSYYSSPPILSYFCLFFYQNDNLYMTIILSILLIIFNIITINMVTLIIQRALNERKKYKNNNDMMLQLVSNMRYWLLSKAKTDVA